MLPRLSCSPSVVEFLQCRIGSQFFKLALLPYSQEVWQHSRNRWISRINSILAFPSISMQPHFLLLLSSEVRSTNGRSFQRRAHFDEFYNLSLEIKPTNWLHSGDLLSKQQLENSILSLGTWYEIIQLVDKQSKNMLL